MAWEEGDSFQSFSPTSQVILFGVLRDHRPDENGEIQIMLRTCKECESAYDDHTAVRFCPSCGSMVHVASGEAAAVLSDSECGPEATATNTKSPVLAALLSFLMVGMGQIYIGQVEKGLTMI